MLVAQAQDLTALWSNWNKKVEVGFDPDSPFTATAVVASSTSNDDDPFAGLEAVSAQIQEEPNLFDQETESSEDEPKIEEPAAEESLDLDIKLDEAPALTAAPPANISATVAKVSKMDTGSKAEWLNDIFAQSSQYYQKSMLMLRDGICLRPWRWTNGFQQDSDTMGTISMEEPSAFRLVFRTNKPYHGYFVPGETNDKFVQDWNKSSTPESWTMTPVIIDDNLFGVLIGIGDSTAYNKNALGLMEKLVEDIATIIKKDPQILKAA
jgi:hypothetical protein